MRVGMVHRGVVFDNAKLAPPPSGDQCAVNRGAHGLSARTETRASYHWTTVGDKTAKKLVAHCFQERVPTMKTGDCSQEYRRKNGTEAPSFLSPFASLSARSLLVRKLSESDGSATSGASSIECFLSGWCLSTRRL